MSNLALKMKMILTLRIKFKTLRGCVRKTQFFAALFFSLWIEEKHFFYKTYVKSTHLVLYYVVYDMNAASCSQKIVKYHKRHKQDVFNILPWVGFQEFGGKVLISRNIFEMSFLRMLKTISQKNFGYNTTQLLLISRK